MLLNQVSRFMNKPPAERRVSIRFFARKALAKLPFMPIQVRLDVAPDEEIRFWWSYICHENHPEREFSAYWGDDHGPLRFVWQFLEPGMVFLDVGAYHGIFSVLAGMKLASGGQVIAFEPSPRERLRFDFHTRMNDLSRVCLEPYAASSGRSKKRFFTVESDFSSMNSLQEPSIEWPKQETIVETIDLDSYLRERQIERVDFMKIDVEGGELQAFQGARHLLTSIRPILICEVLDWVTTPWGYPAREIVDYLAAEDYEWFDFQNDGTLKPHIVRNAYPEIRNYLAVPREKVSLVENWRRQGGPSWR
jgi:FkbM family methyltransferase